jgi:hypothetical protein
MMDEFSEPLTLAERARLRPTADPGALERYLARIPSFLRAVTVLSFAARRSPTEVRDALEAAGELTEQIQALLQPFIDYRPMPPHLAHPENEPDDAWEPREWEDVMFLSVEPPADDAELTALWRAIEQRPSG